MINLQTLQIQFLTVLLVTLGSAKSTESNSARDSFMPTTKGYDSQEEGTGTDILNSKVNANKITETKRTISKSMFGSNGVDERQVTDNDETNHDTKPKRYGSVLGSGFSWKKRDSEHSVDGMNEDQLINRWLEDRYGFSDDFHERPKREAHRKRFIRYFGKILGRGYMKRDAPVFDGIAEDSPEIYVPGELVYIDSDSEEDFASQDELGSPENPSESEDDESEILIDEADIDDDSNAHNKRYFNSDFGGRFMFGKRSGLDKRYGFILGRGFSYGKFGKRSQGKRFFGHVLGNGFSLGKRTPDMDEDKVFVVPEGADKFKIDNDKMGWLMGRGLRTDKRGKRRYGWIFGQGYHLGKRMDESGESPFDETYFVDDDGNIERLQKRFVLTQGYRLSSPQQKRYGYVLNKGFSFGKRSLTESAVDDDDDDNEDEDDSDDSNGDQIKMDKRYGFLLGRTFSFGKRIPPPRTFGTILGNGFTFGKRDENETKQ